MPGPVAAASAKRRTDPARRFRRGSVKSALLQNSPHASLLLPSSQRHLRRRKLPPVRPWIAWPVRNANEADAHLLPFHTALEEKKKRGGGVGRGWTEGRGGRKKKAADAAFGMQQLLWRSSFWGRLFRVKMSLQDKAARSAQPGTPAVSVSVSFWTEPASLIKRKKWVFNWLFFFSPPLF